MLLQFDGLDNIGDENDDYKDEEGSEGEADSDLYILVGGIVDVDVAEEATQVQVGYAEKRSRLFFNVDRNVKYALFLEFCNELGEARGGKVSTICVRAC